MVAITTRPHLAVFRLDGVSQLDTVNFDQTVK
ncbi:MAG: hypothetical protein ACJARE_002518 [Paracoccaceae bacterium]|jgi:hypothetical protein